MKNKFIILSGILIFLLSPNLLSNEPVEKKEKLAIPITKDLKYVDVSHNGKTIRIQKKSEYAKNRYK